MQSRLSLAALFLASSASAQVLVYEIEMTGSQEVPAVQSNGIGTATVRIDTQTGAIGAFGNYLNMSSPVVGAHIHGRARRGTNAGIYLQMQPGGGTSGSYSARGVITPAQVRDLVDGLTYVNIHTTRFPGGEIRGQIDSVPDTGTGLNAPSIDISGAATAGGTLSIACPPGIGSSFIMLGFAGPTLTVTPPIVCDNTGFALAVSPAPFLIPSAAFQLNIPANLTNFRLGVQCGMIDLNRPCLTFSQAHHVQVMP